MLNGLLANLILILHFTFVLGVVIPVPLIVIGGMARWKFIQNSCFRNIHLAMIGVVVVESAIGMICPLTALEQFFREKSGQPTYQGSFIRHWLGTLLFHDWNPWVFFFIYLFSGALILALYFIFQPNWLLERRRHSKK